METTAQSSELVQMNVLDLSAIARRSGGTATLGECRRFAALVALAFPLLVGVLVVGGLVRIVERPSSALTHPILVSMLVPGIVALVSWIRRYTKPALEAFTSESRIKLEHGRIVILDQSYPLTPNAKLRYSRSAIEFMDGHEVLVRKPGFFVQIVEKYDE